VIKLKNIFVSTTFAKDNSKISDVLLMCKKANILNVELGSNHLYEKNFIKIVNQFDFCFMVHNYFPIPKKSFIVNIASFNKYIRNLSIKHIKRAILFCKETNSKLYTFHPGFVGDPSRASKNKKHYDFIWKKNREKKNYKLAFGNMLNSLKKIVNFAKKNKVKVAIETEGCSKKKDNFGLMQEPEEYRKLFKYFTPEDLGINLNVGHLNLASKAFKFSKMKFVNDIENYIVAIELSHNNGIEDEHLPIKKKAWYWTILKRSKFVTTPKILEYRNCKIDKIKKSIELLIKN
jgi:sugar phosphate isomerase/epimerase|tara:strand:- start:2590 stop:3459 length:870 start_codon:yes stop_codon:yes gene_type:complete